jgi:glucokinase
MEKADGAVSGIDNVVLLYVGRGVGSATLVNGDLLLGSGGLTGEIGHCYFPGNTVRCNCGKTGCLETIADGVAIARRAVDALGEGASSSLGDCTREEITAEAVARAAADGDALAIRIYEEVGEILGQAASWLINIINPEVLLIGGAVAGAGEVLLQPLRASAMRHAVPQAAERVRIRTWTTSRRPGVAGAVHVAIQYSQLPARTPRA